MKTIVFALSLLIAALAPAKAQFADQATFAGTGAGTANAQTITLPNVSAYADVRGVIIKFIPAATNTAAATLQITGVAGTPSLRKPNGSGLTALVGGEVVSGQPTYVMYDETFFDIVSPTNLPIGAAQLQNSALSFGVPVNLAIAATVGSNQLTVAVKALDETDPSATNPVLIPFRNATIASGAPSIISLQSALSFTVNSTNTMGCVNGQMCRLWAVVINNAGTPALCLFNALSGKNISSINEANLQTSASGTTGGSSNQTYYCSTSAVTSKAIRIIGYVDIQETTAGTWSSGPSYVQLFGPGIKRPGEIVQQLTSTTNTTGTTSSASFALLSVSQTVTVTPQSAANIFRIASSGTMSNSTTASSDLTISRTINAGAQADIGNPAQASPSGAVSVPTSLITYDVPATTGVIVYTFRARAATGGTVSYPTTGTGSLLEVWEIMSSIDDPANDNKSASQKVG